MLGRTASLFVGSKEMLHYWAPKPEIARFALEASGNANFTIRLPNSLLEIDGLRPRAAARIIDPNPSSSRFTAAQAGFFDLSQLGSRGRLCLAAAE